MHCIDCVPDYNETTATNDNDTPERVKYYTGLFHFLILFYTYRNLCCFSATRYLCRENCIDIATNVTYSLFKYVIMFLLFLSLTVYFTLCL